MITDYDPVFLFWSLAVFVPGVCGFVFSLYQAIRGRKYQRDTLPCGNDMQE